MNLTQLGWNALFEEHFSIFKEQGFLPARVFREDRECYLIYSVDGEMSAEISGKYRHQTLKREEFPAVGDWVAIKPIQGERKAIIHSLLPRKSSFSRKIVGGFTEEQILAANIDTAFLISGLDGDFNLKRIERYISVAYNSGANPIIILNKTDLCQNLEDVLIDIKQVAIGIPVYAISASQKSGLEQLIPYLQSGQTIVLLGSSGVGKSSLINCFLGIEKMATNEVREDDSRGRHTTCYRELILLPKGAMVIDTPGMRELQMWLDEDDLEGSFQDIENLAINCRFNNCEHHSEPNCAIKEAIKEGKLDSRRLDNYRKLKREIRRLERKQSQKLKLIEKKACRKSNIRKEPLLDEDIRYANI